MPGSRRRGMTGTGLRMARLGSCGTKSADRNELVRVVLTDAMVRRFRFETLPLHIQDGSNPAFVQDDIRLQPRSVLGGAVHRQVRHRSPGSLRERPLLSEDSGDGEVFEHSLHRKQQRTVDVPAENLGGTSPAQERPDTASRCRSTSSNIPTDGARSYRFVEGLGLSVQPSPLSRRFPRRPSPGRSRSAFHLPRRFLWRCSCALLELRSSKRCGMGAARNGRSPGVPIPNEACPPSSDSGNNVPPLFASALIPRSLQRHGLLARCPFRR